MSTYVDLDAAIIAAVRGEATQFHEILGCVRDPLCALEWASVIKPGDGFRAVDRRLQALRKAGKLTYDRKRGWAVAS